MPMNVTIRFTGDVIVYDDRTNWNFVFVTDDFHITQVKRNSASLVPGGLRQAGVKIRNLLLEFGQAPTTTNSSDFSQILNMSAVYMHDKDSSGLSNLMVEQASGQGREIIHLRIANFGHLDGDDFVNDYWIEDLGSGTTNFVGHPIARTITLTFEMTDPSPKPALVLVEKGVAQPIASWNYDPAGLDIHFDNDCGGTGSRLDFLHYYDWVYDKSDYRKFLAGRSDGKGGGGSVMSPQGNCDPAGIDPPPGP